MNKEAAKKYLQEFLEKPGIINVDAGDVVFFLGKEGTTERFYGFGTSDRERGLQVAVNAALEDLKKSLTGQPDGVIMTIYGDALLLEVNDAANYVAELLCGETTNMIFGFVAAESEEPLQVMLAAARRK